MAAMIRGSVLMGHRAFAEQNFGAGAFEQILATLPPKLAEPVHGILLAQSWYPLESIIALADAGSEVFQVPDFHERLGAFNAEFHRNFVHRFVLRFTSPMWMMERGARMWRDIHSSGRLVVEPGPRPQTMVGTLHDMELVNRSLCRLLAAFFTRAGQLTGAREHRVTHTRCRAEGASACVFEGVW